MDRSDMLPVRMPDKARNCGLVDAVFISECPASYVAQLIPCANGDYLIGRQFRGVNHLSTRHTLGIASCAGVVSTRDALRMHARGIPVTCEGPAFVHHVEAIVLRSPKKEMVRVWAGAVVALVTDEEAIGDRAVVQFPRHAVSRKGFATTATGTNAAVPVGSCGPRPYPARPKLRSMHGGRAVLIDSGPEAISERDARASNGRLRVHIEPPIRCAMLPAVSAVRGLSAVHYNTVGITRGA